MEKIVFYLGGKAGCIFHCIPDYEFALSKGLNAVISEAAEMEQKVSQEPGSPDKQQRIDFYQAVRIAMPGIINYATNLSKKAAELAATEQNPWKKKVRNDGGGLRSGSSKSSP